VVAFDLVDGPGVDGLTEEPKYFVLPPGLLVYEQLDVLS